MASHVSASIMCGRLADIAADLNVLEAAGVDSIHVDVMDGHFVPNLGFSPDLVAAMNEVTTLPLHAHMMVSNPAAFVDAFAEAGTDVYVFHVEATRFPHRLIRQIRERGMSPGVAINPGTPVDFLRGLDVAHVLLMSVEPGFAGQPWEPVTADRLRRLRDVLTADITVGVDGNVSLAHAALAADLGASLFVCGTASLFTGTNDYRAAVAAMRTATRAADKKAPATR